MKLANLAVITMISAIKAKLATNDCNYRTINFKCEARRRPPKVGLWRAKSGWRDYLVISVLEIMIKQKVFTRFARYRLLIFPTY